MSSSTQPRPVGSLAELRHEAGLTQAQLAMRADCSRASVALLEAGYEPKRSEVLRRVHDVLASATAK